MDTAFLPGFLGGFVRPLRPPLLAGLFLASALVGAEEKASHQVSPFAGSLSYSIPIAVPPFHGLEPRLSLSYSSEGRNGFVGVGWTLTGFSTIERVNSGRGAAFFDASDVYLLDGQKLVPCPPSGSVSPSCTTGGTHSTEVESYLRIARSGDTWTVWGKDGTKTVFSPIYVVPPSAFLPGGILRWGQTSVTDTHNNVVTYVWESVDGDVYPTHVLYNGYAVSLFRELRPDPIRFGASTTIGTSLYRLRSVFVSLSGVSQIHAYKLGYTTSALTGRSLLASVQQYGKDVSFNLSTGEILSGTSLPAQTFTYQADTLGKSFQPMTSTAWCPSGVHLTGDFNGDGRTDRACTNYGGPNGLEVSLATGTGFASPSPWLNWGFAHPIVGDFNSDGKSDIADYDRWNSSVHVALSTGTNFPNQPPVYWGSFTNGATACAWNKGVVGTGDFNGDGITDMSCRNYETGDIFIGLSEPQNSRFAMGLWANLGCDQFSERTGALDFDGNGLDDWYCVGVNGNEQFYVFPSTGQSFIWPAFGSLDGSFCPHEYYVFGDVNADGRADATCAINGKVALSTGRQFEISTSPSGGFCASWDPNIFAADVDGDGASEIVCNNNMEGSPSLSDIHVRKWTGSSLGPAENWKDNWCTGSVSGGDFNGDGKADLYCDSVAAPVAVAGTAGVQSDLISSLANGLGGITQVAYTSSSAFPNTNNPSPKYTVTSATLQDGRGGSSTSTYTYSGSMFDRKERRFLGFRYMKETLPCIAGESSCPTVETWLKQILPQWESSSAWTGRMVPVAF